MSSAELATLLALCAVGPALALALALSVLRERESHDQADGTLVSLVVPVATASSEPFFQSLHALLRCGRLRTLLDGGAPWMSFETVAQHDRIDLQLWLPRRDVPIVESLLQTVAPGLVLAPAEPRPAPGGAVATGVGRLVRGDDLPIRTAFTGEPLAGLFAALARMSPNHLVRVQLLVRPTARRWQQRARQRAQQLRDARRRTASAAAATRSNGPTRAALADAEAIEQKVSAVGFDCVVRAVVAAPTPSAAAALLRSISASLAPYDAANRIELRAVRSSARLRAAVDERRFPYTGSFILTAPELAGLWHVPADAPLQLGVVQARRLPPPRGVDAGERTIGVATWPNDPRAVRLSIADARRHLHVLGPTGTGKTTALLNLAAGDIAAGRGVAVLDPKGDLVAALLERIPPQRINDVILISPEGDERSVGINPLELGPGDDRDLVAENTLSIFKRIYERFWGPRTDDVLKAALLTLLRRPGATLAHIPLLLTDASFRLRVTAHLDDPFGLEGFWRSFDKLSDAQRAETIGPLLNKLRDFLIRQRLRRLLCQPRSTVDLRQVVDSGQILLADLSIGRWGEAAAGLVGSFLVAKLWQATLARAAIPENDRRDFFLFIDEFQQFLGIAGPFADALAQARSLRLSLTLANQHLGQLPAEIQAALASNARSRAVFQCGQDDATALAREFAPLDRAALLALPRYEMALRLSIDGQTSRPFTVRTLPPVAVAGALAAHEVQAAALLRYGRPAAEVDRDLRASLAAPDDPAPSGPIAGLDRP